MLRNWYLSFITSPNSSRISMYIYCNPVTNLSLGTSRMVIVYRPSLYLPTSIPTHLNRWSSCWLNRWRVITCPPIWTNGSTSYLDANQAPHPRRSKPTISSTSWPTRIPSRLYWSKLMRLNVSSTSHRCTTMVRRPCSCSRRRSTQLGLWGPPRTNVGTLYFHWSSYNHSLNSRNPSARCMWWTRWCWSSSRIMIYAR